MPLILICPSISTSWLSIALIIVQETRTPKDLGMLCHMIILGCESHNQARSSHFPQQIFGQQDERTKGQKEKRHKDKETKRQRDKKTKRQKVKKTKRQTDKKTKRFPSCSHLHFLDFECFPFYNCSSVIMDTH